jgi:uncharacterized protein Yka (UPF0111/DUF47 family)
MEEQKSLNEKQLATLVEKVEVIEDALSITNEDSVQNMETMTDQISFLDTEVRKLWGHRKGYLDNFKKQTASSDSNAKKLTNISAKTNSLEDRLESLNQKIELAEDLQLKITMLTNELNKQKNIAEENTEALEAIDQYRLQNNQKISDVLNRLNALSREADEIERELRRINSVLTEEETNE